jgi:hypothetical protein
MRTQFLDFIRDHLVTLPVLAKFALGMVMLVTIPRFCRRLHVPAAVGLLLGGVIVGPYVLGFFSMDRPIADFMAELGKLLLMFFAGLDIDLALFRRAWDAFRASWVTTTSRNRYSDFWRATMASSRCCWACCRWSRSIANSSCTLWRTCSAARFSRPRR